MLSSPLDWSNTPAGSSLADACKAELVTLPAPWPAGIELNYPKIATKLGILVVPGGLLGMGNARQRRTGEAVPRPVFALIGFLALTAAGIAVLW